jgi:hypothetical protein
VPKPNPAYKAPKAAVAAKPFGGWQPKGSHAVEKDGLLTVTGDNRSPFLGIAGLRHPGPVTLRIKTKGEGGAAKVQWRTSAQETFPESGQVQEFTLKDDSETTLTLPVSGSLFHIRLYLPAQSHAVVLDSIEMVSGNPGAKPQRWDFSGDSTGAAKPKA